MTIKEFESWRFSINTQVKVDGLWHKVIEIDFEDGNICLKNGRYIDVSQVERIKEVPTPERVEGGQDAKV